MSVLTDISKSYSERQKGSQNAHMLGCQVRIWIGWNLGWNTCAFPRWQVVKQKVEARLLFCLCSKLTWNDLPVNKQTLMVKSCCVEVSGETPMLKEWWKESHSGSCVSEPALPGCWHGKVTMPYLKHPLRASACDGGRGALQRWLSLIYPTAQQHEC